jgi:hypothetical protein
VEAPEVCITKTFYGGINSALEKAIVLINVSYFHHSLMVLGKAGANPIDPLSRLHFKVRLLTMYAAIV